MTPSSAEAYLALDYAMVCGLNASDVTEIEPDIWQANHIDDLLVDIREKHEQPRLADFCASNGVTLMEIPLSNLYAQASLFSGKRLTVICQSGKRSLAAVRMFEEMDKSISAKSLKGGVNALLIFK
jgi:rhodanese-related sulfurtransferase